MTHAPETAQPSCSRRLFLLGSATTFAGAFLAACGSPAPAEIAETDVPVGSAVIVDNFIIAQPTAGNYVAYSTLCPHEGARITKVQGDEVRCMKHGSTFAIEDGAVITGPAERPLQPASVVNNGGTLTVE